MTLTGRLSTVLFLLILWISNISAKEVRIVCYYTNWSVYRPGDAKFNPQNINPYLCTHLVYAFGGFTKENTLKPFDKYQDVEKGGYAKFVGLKTYNKNLKTLLAIGGWNEGSTRFSPMVANAERRKELVKNTIKFLRQNHFDGLDLDWEYPSFRDGGKSRDRDNYAQLVQELREEFERESEKTGRQRLLLTMAVPAGIEYIKKGYDIPKLTKYLDWMNILSYDYHSAYEPAVNHHSPLYPTEEESEYSYDIDLNIDYTIKHYIQSGAEKSKLVLGIPTYGRSYTLYNPDANEIGAPADGPGEMGEATRENGYLAYYEICENIKSDEWQVETPYPEVMGPYAFKETQWVSYDDADIARRKAEYVAEHGLGGIMFWSIDNDDFRGKCGGGPYPIIEAAKEALLKAYGLSDSNLLEATKKPIKSRTRGRTRGTTKSVSITESTVINSGGKQSTRRKSHRISGKSETGSLPRRRRPTIKKSNKSTTTESNTLGSSLLVTPSYTTPAPPSTPDSGGDFKCEDEGFFPHPKDCKKYFWCLSGPSDLGIIAHQFTCPAGLYFNKAASSCDYTQNVLCNKKISKSSATSTAAPSSTTISTTSTTSISSTRRSPPKITAATSRTTYKSTTAEPEYEEEYEYYDDEEEEIRSKDTEEDPRVIKELIELIKKAGGLEELEKQLKLQDDNSPVTSSGSTTPGSISKSLFQRVLGRTTLRDSLAKTTPRYNFVNRNSRGPQNEGISRGKETDVRPSKSRPQYTSIIRTRPSTAATVDEDVDEEEEYVNQHNITKTTQNILASDNSTEHSRTFYRKSQPEYVTIRRQRISTTTAGSLQEDDIEGRSFSRSSFKQLGEDGEFTADTEENDEIVRNTLRSSTISTPYVTIQRSRPTTSVTETTGFESESKNRGNGTIETEGTTVTNEYVTIRRQRPSVEGDLTTSKYIEIRTRGTTTAAIAPEPDNTDLPVTTIRYRSTTVIEKELTTTPTSNGIGSNITLNKTDAQADIFNLVEENTVENANSEATQETKLESSGLDAKDVINNIREITKVEEGNNEATTIISIQKEEGNTEANKNKTTLLDTRPFSINFRRTTVTPTTTSETSPVQQSNKVSVSTTPRTTFRKKAFGARGLLVNRNKQKITDNAGNKENSVIDFETKAQYDDNNDNELVNRKRFRNSISSDKISENSFEEEPDSKGDAGNSEYQIRLRNRGQSRFTLQTIGTTTPRSRIRIVTSEPDVDYETTEYVRKYRPDISYEIADLSSLTAVDLKDSSARKRNGFGRRRRPTVVVTESAITPTTTRKPEPSLKTSARTVPLARKFLENSAFNKGRRIRLPNLSTSSTTEGSTLSTTNNEAQATQKRFISRLRRPTQRVDVQNATLTSNISLTGHTNISATKLLPKAPRFRKFSTVPDVDTSTNGDVEFRSVKDVSTTRKPQTIRRRKILRKLRVSTQRPIVEPISPSASNKTLQHQFESVPKNNTISAITGVTNFSEESLNINIITKSDLLDINKNQTQLDDVLTTTLPTTSTSNYMREEGNVNTTSALQDNINIISESDKSDLIDDKLKDDIDSKSSEDDDEEEDENIKLSESIVRENSQLSDFQTGNVIRLFEKPGSKVVNQFRPDNSKEENIKRRRPVTEPSIIIRTRKIIRKLNPTETPSITDDGNKKVRKVVRRLRPTVSPINQIDSNLEKTRGNANTGFLSRRRFGSNRPSTSTTENINQENVANSKSLFSKRRFNSFNRKGAPDNSAKSKVIGTKPEKGINKSIYNRVKLSSTTSTTEATTNILTELPLITEVSTNDYQSSTDDQFTTSILSSTATNDSTTDQTFEDISTSEKLYISHSSTEQGLDVENNVSTEIVLENFSSTDSIDYTSDMEGIQTLNTEPLDTEIKQAQSSTPKEDTFSTDTILRSTTPLPNMIIEHTDKGVISTVFEESSASTYIDETSTLNESSTATTSDTSPEITIKTTEVTVPTKRIVSTTESALNRLLKRRRFGLNSNITDLQESGQIQGTESGKKDRLPSLNTRLRLKPFSQSTTEKQSETKENIDSSNYQIRTDHAAIVDIGNSSVTLSSESSAVVNSDTTDIINQEGTVFETQSTAAATTNRIKDADTSTNPTLYLTTDYHNDTSETQSIVLSNEITSTLFTQSYATDITREQSTEMANSDIESSTTLDEDISENTDTTSALLIFSTQELAVFTDDNDTSIVSNFVTTLKPSTTTIESTASETNLSESESTADTTPVATVIATSTTTRRPNRLFRPIDSRPKYTVKYRPSESTSSIASTLDSSTKSYSRYKFRSKNRNRFTFSSTTEKYDENEELGYGPVKEFKSILRVSANIEGRNEYYESKKLGEDDEEEYIDEEENISDEENNDNENSNAYIRSSLYNRAFPYKPIKPVIQKPSTFTKAEEAEYDEHEFDNTKEDLEPVVDEHSSTKKNLGDFTEGENDEKINTTKISESPEVAVSPVTRASNAPIDVLNQKSTTRTYKGFRSTTPATIQNLSDINIAVINERNKNLFSKTRKVNTPVAFSGASSRSRNNNTIYNSPHLQNKPLELDNSGKYNTPHYTNTSEIVSVNETIPESNKTITIDVTQSIPDELLTTKALPSSEVTANKTTETIPDSKSTQVTEKSSTLLHIFAETEAPISETTITSNQVAETTNKNKKIEKLIEINRVIEVHAKEEFKNGTGVVGTVSKAEPIVDKIGSVSRITEIKVVEDKNATANDTNNNSPIDLVETSRTEKKMEIANTKDNNFNIPIVTSSDITQINQINIDTVSLHKITPRPFYKAETSTIPLEGLFQTDSPLKYHHSIKSDSPNEILQGEHSRYVNVRILEQDITDPNAKRNLAAKYVPIKLLRDDEEITMKADVVEVRPEHRHQTIKIAPIKVSLQTKV